MKISLVQLGRAESPAYRDGVQLGQCDGTHIYSKQKLYQWFKMDG